MLQLPLTTILIAGIWKFVTSARAPPVTANLYGERPIQVQVVTPQGASPVPQIMPDICWHYQQGRCSYGEACRHTHNPEQTDHAPSTNRSRQRNSKSHADRHRTSGELRHWVKVDDCDYQGTDTESYEALRLTNCCCSTTTVNLGRLGKNGCES